MPTHTMNILPSFIEIFPVIIIIIFCTPGSKDLIIIIPLGL